MSRALIIEDEWTIAQFIGELAIEAGASALMFAAGEREAVSLAMAEQPDIILSDVRLLEGTGPRAVRKIVERYGAIPVIFITGTPNECEACGCPAEIMTKPVAAAAFIALFRNLLREPQVSYPETSGFERGQARRC